MENKIDQILLNQSTIIVALAALYADDCEDVEVLNQLNNRIGEMKKLLSPTKPFTNRSKECEPCCECNDVDVQYEHECEHCEKNFVYTIDYDPCYSEEKADCLNGGEHNYEKICGYPVELFENKRRCSMCDKQITVKPDALHENTGVKV